MLQNINSKKTFVFYRITYNIHIYIIKNNVVIKIMKTVTMRKFLSLSLILTLLLVDTITMLITTMVTGQCTVNFGTT